MTPGIDSPKISSQLEPERTFSMASPISTAALPHAIQLPDLLGFSRGGAPGLTDLFPLTISPFLHMIFISAGGLLTWFVALRHIQNKYNMDLSVKFETGMTMVWL